MAELDLDAIETRNRVFMLPHATEDALIAEVRRLRTLRVEIEQGIGGPATIKVWRDNVLRFNGIDYSALMERDEARVEVRRLHDEAWRMSAAIARAEALHVAMPIYDMCDHADRDACGAWETVDGEFVCGPELGYVCGECIDESGDHSVDFPCATVRALAGAS